MATLISRIGSTVAVEIPEELLRQANLSVGDPVEWTLTAEGQLALQRRARLTSLLSNKATTNGAGGARGHGLD